MTAWSLPLMGNVDAVECRRTPAVDGQPVNAEMLIERIAGGEAYYDFVVEEQRAERCNQRMIDEIRREVVERLP